MDGYATVGFFFIAMVRCDWFLVLLLSHPVDSCRQAFVDNDGWVGLCLWLLALVEKKKSEMDGRIQSPTSFTMVHKNENVRRNSDDVVQYCTILKQLPRLKRNEESGRVFVARRLQQQESCCLFGV